MVRNNLPHLTPSFQELDLQIRNLENAAFQLYIASGHLKEAWRDVVIASRTDQD